MDNPTQTAAQNTGSEVKFRGPLIPTNGVHISESFYPKGYTVARHDHEGFTSEGRWFSTLEAARTYARHIS